MSDENRYKILQQKQDEEWEALCKCCGACCGVVEGDSCEHLEQVSGSKYRCNIYENRFGVHKTQNGREMKCVPIRNILHESWPGDQKCAYKSSKW